MYNEILDELIVVKRSGQRVNFNASKIAIAIKKSFDSVYIDYNEKKIFEVFGKVLTYINNNYKERKTITVEDIQDIIETTLKESKFNDVYNSFKEYRQKRAASRNVFAEKGQHKFVKAIEKLQEKTFNENNNFTSYDLLNKFGKIILNEYSKAYLLDNKYLKSLEEGNIYIHNLEGLPLGLISSVNLKNNKSNQNIDDFIREMVFAKDEISENIGINNLESTIKEFVIIKYRYVLKNNLKKYFNLYGLLEFVSFKKYEETINKAVDFNQEIFKDFYINENIEYICKTAIKDSLNETSNYIKEAVGKIFNSIKNLNTKINYTVSIKEPVNMITSSIIDEIILYLSENDYLERINVIFKIKNEDENYINKIAELIILKKNVSISYNENIEYFSNGTKVYENINDEENTSKGKLIISATSINLARLGLKFKNKNQRLFFTELEQIVELVKNQLLLSFETIGNKTKNNYQILFNGNVYDDEKLESNPKIRKVIKSGVLNVGVIGLKECIISLTDENNYEKLTYKILDTINQSLKKYSEDNKVNFTLFEPVDIKSRKCLLSIDKAIYGDNKDITTQKYYGLISELKPFSKDDYAKLAILQNKFTGGEHLSINLPSNASIKKVYDLIIELKRSNINFVNIIVGKK